MALKVEVKEEMKITFLYQFNQIISSDKTVAYVDHLVCTEFFY